MKASKRIVTLLTLCTVLALTGCAGKDAAGTGSPSTSASGSAEDQNAALDDLYQQENQLFADHKTAWDKAFALMSKSNADPSGNYADYLKDTVDSNPDAFTEEELNTLHEDIETIRGIEEQIAQLENQLDSAGTVDSSNGSDDTVTFRHISGTDFDGNDVDESLFSENAVTVVNFWFTGCKPCVAELSKLNEMNEALKSMGGEVIGVNTDTFDGNEDAIAEAKKVLESQGAEYRNLSLVSDSDAGKYAADIMAFPTTILVDRNGRVVGEPLLGGVDIQENYDALMKQIQAVIDADKAAQ